MPFKNVNSGQASTQTVDNSASIGSLIVGQESAPEEVISANESAVEQAQDVGDDDNLLQDLNLEEQTIDIDNTESPLNNNLVSNDPPLIGGSLMIDDYLDNTTISDLIHDIASVEHLVIDSPANISSILASTGLNKNKPEILMISDFIPAFKQSKDPLPMLKLIRSQFAIRVIKCENIIRIFKEFKKNPDLKSNIEELEKSFKKNIRLLKAEIGFLKALYKIVDDVKESLDFKRGFLQSSNPSNVQRTDSIPDDENVSLDSILIGSLLFSQSGLESFANTKILMQMMSDLSNVMRKHSPSLFDSHIQSRSNDVEHLKISKDIVSSGKSFSFTNASISSKNLPRNLTLKIEYDSFVESLPTDTDDRIKLLLTTVSKDLRVSAGIAALADTDLDAIYAISKTTTNVTTALLGNVSDTIFNLNPPPNSLTSILKVRDTQGNTVLPFERRAIVGTDGKTFIPGSVFFADAILQGTELYDLDPLKQYTQSTVKIVEDVKSAIQTLLNIGTFDQTLHSANLFTIILLKMKSILEKVTFNESLSSSTAVNIAVLSESQTDKIVRHLLYKKLILGDDESLDDDTGNSRFTTETTTDKIIHRINAKYQVSGHRGSDDSNRKILTLPDSVLRLSLQDNSPLFTDIKNLSDEVFELAMSLSNGLSGTSSQTGFMTEDGSGRTRFNFFTKNTILALMYEIFGAFFAKYIDAKFTKSQVGSTSISVNLQKNASSLDTVKILISSAIIETVEDLESQTNLSPMAAIANKLRLDDLIPKNILDVISSVASSISLSYDKAKTFLDPTASDERGALLKRISETKEGRDLLATLNGDQLRLMWKGYSDYSDILSAKSLTQDELLFDKESLRLLRIYLSSPANRIPEGQNLRIVSVGMPSGMLDSLRFPVYKQSISKTISSTVTRDVIRIDVHKRDIEFDDIVFKPITFLFDMSRHASIESNKSNHLYENFNLSDFRTGGESPSQTSLIDAVNNSEYSFLKNSDAASLFRNHVNSYLLWLYLKSVTGADISESKFLFNETLTDLEIDPAATSAIQNTAIQGATGQTTSSSSSTLPPFTIGGSVSVIENADLGPAPAQFSESQDSVLTRYLQSRKSSLFGSDVAAIREFLSSLVFTSGINRRRVTAPKIFERIFHLPVDPDDFAVDIEKTMSTKSGKNMFNSVQFQQILASNDAEESKQLKNRRKSSGQMALSELYVTISLYQDS